jgi:hypothetical protein
MRRRGDGLAAHLILSRFLEECNRTTSVVVELLVDD